MARKGSTHYDSPTFRTEQRKLICSVLLGLILGTFLAMLSDISYAAWMCVTLQDHASIVILYVNLLFPFLLCSVVVLLSADWLLPWICFARCLSFSFVSMRMLLTLGDSGWFLRELLMFGHLASLPLLIWFCIKHLKMHKRCLRPTVCTCLTVLAMAAVADYSISILLGKLGL